MRAELAKVDVLVVPTSAYNYTVQEIQASVTEHAVLRVQRAAPCSQRSASFLQQQQQHAHQRKRLAQWCAG